MTVSTSTSTASYAANGSTTTFAYPFKIFADTDLVVILRNTATSVETVQVLNSNYTVTGAGNVAGGNVLFTVAPASGNTVFIRRELPLTQETDFVPNDPFPADAHEDALDKLTMLVQQGSIDTDRAILFPQSDAGLGLTNVLPSVNSRRSKLLQFANDGSVDVVDPADIGSSILGANYIVDTFTGTGSTTIYALSAAPGSTNNTAIYIDGVYQAKSNYSVVGSTLTFTTAPPLNSAIEIVIGDAIPAGAATTATAVSYTQGGAGAVSRNVQSRLRDFVSVKDFGAVGDGVTDDTAAIEAAQQASKFVYVPAGDYVVTGLRIYDQVNLMGAGYENTRFLQGDPAQPAINCTSDASVGQLLSLRLENFGVIGHASATVEAVKIEALGVYAIYRSHFDFIIGSCYQALNMQASTANNVFYCTFKIDVVGTQTTAVVLNGGVYNTYDFFIAGVGGTGRMMQHNGFNNTFIRLVGDGTIFCNGQNITYISPTIEELYAATPSDTTGIYLNGFNQTLILPTIILNPTNAAKLTHCMRTFSNSLIINPRFIVGGITSHPFEPLSGGTTFTLQGPGQNGCANKMEVEYTGLDAGRDLRLVTKVGDVSSFISGASTFSGKSTQYLAPAAGASINHRIFSSTDAMIFEPAGTVTLINITIGYLGASFREGQTLSVYTSEAITTLSWSAGGADVSLFPTSMTAGQTIQFVYRSANNKWYPIGT